MRAEALRIVTPLRLRRGLYRCSTVARKVWCGVRSVGVLYRYKALASLAIYRRRATLARTVAAGLPSLGADNERECSMVRAWECGRNLAAKSALVGLFSGWRV